MRSAMRSAGPVLLVLLLLLLSCITPRGCEAVRVATACRGQSMCVPVVDGNCVDLSSSTSASASIIFQTEARMAVSVFASTDCSGTPTDAAETETSANITHPSASPPSQANQLSFTVVQDLATFCTPESAIPSREVGVDDTAPTVGATLALLLSGFASPSGPAAASVAAITGSITATFPTSVGTTQASRVGQPTPAMLGGAAPFTEVQQLVDGSFRFDDVAQVDNGSTMVTFDILSDLQRPILLPVGTTQVVGAMGLALQPGPLAADNTTITANLQCSAPLLVTDTAAPTVTCPASVRVPVAGSVFSSGANLPLPTITDNGVIASMRVPVSAVLRANATSNATATATDTAGNTGTCTSIVIGVDSTPPVLSGCIKNITLQAEVDRDLTALYVQPAVTAVDRETDGDGNIPVMFSVRNGTRLAVGRHVVTATATDAYGNTARCTFDVFVMDRPRLESVSRLDVVAADGDDITLRCSFTGYPRPTITWTVEGGPNARQTDEDALSSALRFPRVAFSDFGAYSCRASSPLGEAAAPLIILTVRPTLDMCHNTSLFLRPTHALGNPGNTNGPPFWEQEDASDIRAVRRDQTIAGRVKTVLMLADAVLVVLDEEVRAYTRLLHRHLWSITTPGPIVASRRAGPVLLGDLLVVTLPDRVVGYDTATQTSRWSLTFASNTTYACTGVVRLTNEVYIVCGSDDDGLRALSLPSTQANPSTAWSEPFALTQATWPPAFDAGDNMFLTTASGLYRIELVSGTTLHTAVLIDTPPTQPAMLTQGDVIVPIVISGTGHRIVSFPADSDLQMSSWELQLDLEETIDGALSVAGTLLVVPTSDRLLVLTKRTGHARWTFGVSPPPLDEPLDLLAHEVLATSSVSLLQVLQYQANTTTAPTTQAPASTATTVNGNQTTTATATAAAATTTTTTTTTAAARGEMRPVTVYTQFRMFVTTSTRFFQSWMETMEQGRMVPANASAQHIRDLNIPPTMAISKGVLHLVSGAGPSPRTAAVMSASPAGLSLFSPPSTTIRALSTCSEIDKPEVSVRSHHVAIVRSAMPRLDISGFSGFLLDITTAGQTVRLSGVPAAARLPDLLPGAEYRITALARVDTGMAVQSGEATTFSMPAAPTVPEAGRVLLVVQVAVQANATAGDEDVDLVSTIAGSYFLVQGLRQVVCGDIPSAISRSTQCYVRAVYSSASGDRARRAPAQATVEVAAETSEGDETTVAAALAAGLQDVPSSAWLADLGGGAAVASMSSAPQIIVAPPTTTTTTATTTDAATTMAASTLSATEPGSSGSSDNTQTIAIAVVCAVVGMALIVGLVVVYVNRKNEQRERDRLFLQNEGAVLEMMDNTLHNSYDGSTQKDDTFFSDNRSRAHDPLPSLPKTIDRPPVPLPAEATTATMASRPPAPLPTNRAPMPPPTGTLPPTHGGGTLAPGGVGTLASTVLPVAAIEQEAAASFCDIEKKDVNLRSAIRNINDQITLYLGMLRTEEGALAVRGYQFKTPPILPDVVANLAAEEQFSELLELKHKNVCKAYGMCLSIPPVLLMENTQAGSVYAYLSRNEATPVVNRIAMMHQAAMGLEYVSSKRIVHGNIWSQELFLTPDMTVKLSCAPLLRAVTSALGMAHLKRAFQSRKRWAAPETANDKYSTASDVWALGVTFWEMLMSCKQQPYAHIRNVSEVLPRVQKGERLTQPDNCPEELWDLLTGCWKPSRAQRPSIQMIVQVLTDMKVDMVTISETSA